MVTRLNDPRFMKMFKERLMKTETIEQVWMLPQFLVLYLGR